MASLAAFNSPGIQSSGCCVGQRTLLHLGRQVSSAQCWVWKDACEFRIPGLLGLLEWGAGENVGWLASGPRLLTSFSSGCMEAPAFPASLVGTVCPQDRGGRGGRCGASGQGPQGSQVTAGVGRVPFWVGTLWRRGFLTLWRRATGEKPEQGPLWPV